ncbi:MAG: hypothetical protein LIQ31_01615 [Planctomycetes bacterium]|nr:hypothetical protein [Planctomycetota bacterium]
MAKVGNKGMIAKGGAKPGAKAGAKGRDLAAMKARSRLAARSRRSRFFKENKARITIAAVVFFLLMAILFLTPYGPNIYRQRIQERMFSSPGVLAPEVTNDLVRLGRFYSFTFRADKGLETYDEVGQLYYGFKFTEYMADPSGAEDRQFEAERLKKRGEILGPPYTVNADNLPGVGRALFYAAEYARSYRPKQFAVRLYQLYNNDFYERHPDACDPDMVQTAKGAEDKLLGRR